MSLTGVDMAFIVLVFIILTVLTFIFILLTLALTFIIFIALTKCCNFLVVTEESRQGLI